MGTGLGRGNEGGFHNMGQLVQGIARAAVLEPWLLG